MNTVIQRDSKGRNEGRDLTGERFNSLVILGPTDRRDNGYIVWRAQCDCGNVIERPSYRFIRGMKTCGCGPTGRPRIPDSGAHVNALYQHYTYSARRRSIRFDLSKEQARELFESDCHYCGAPPSVTYTHVNLSGDYPWNGIDRRDSAMGYVPENCVPCCKTCNWAKRDMSENDFKEWLSRAFHHTFTAER